MAIRNEDWDAIHRAIDASIAAAVSRLRPSGWRKALNLLREWGVLGVNVTIIVALLALAATEFHQATARIQKETTFETKTGDRLDAIEKRLTDIEASIFGLRTSQPHKTPRILEVSRKLRTCSRRLGEPKLRLMKRFSKMQVQSYPSCQPYSASVGCSVSILELSLIPDNYAGGQCWICSYSL